MNPSEHLLALMGEAPPDDMQDPERRHRMWGELCDLADRITHFAQRWWEMDPELRRCHERHHLRAFQPDLPFAPRRRNRDTDLPPF